MMGVHILSFIKGRGVLKDTHFWGFFVNKRRREEIWEFGKLEWNERGGMDDGESVCKARERRGIERIHFKGRVGGEGVVEFTLVSEIHDMMIHLFLLVQPPTSHLFHFVSFLPFRNLYMNFLTIKCCTSFGVKSSWRIINMLVLICM